MAESFKHVPVAQVVVANAIMADVVTFEFRLANPDDPGSPIPLDVRYSMPVGLAREVHAQLGVAIEDLLRRSAELYRRGPA